MQRDRSPLGAILLLAGLLGARAEAQTPAPQDYGTEDESITVLGPADFVAEDGTASTSYPPSTSRRWSDAGGWLIAPLNMLPNGCRVTRITYYFRDADPDENLTLCFSEIRLNPSNGASGGTVCIITTYPQGAPGDSRAANVNSYDIRYRDVEEDGDSVLHYYYIRVRTPAGDDTTAIRAIEVRWRRQVSPAPQAATFNDVPTNHPFFQFVEALADSGITVGCGGGNYCPDSPLTRGQMAVFLAKALGLHWPWDAP